MPESPLDLFHPLLADWFAEAIGEPTPVQAAAWPAIRDGEHVLVTAPTGSGKTLTAFFWSLNQLLTGAWPTGGVRVLYVSPLKALNTDIRDNLSRPLAALREVFREAGERWPDVRVLTRSGDTPQSDRQRMIRKPPEILITTPESLNLILASPRARDMLTGLRTVILDEIHAVAGGKRGTHLITAVDRLVPLCGEFQRVALSATVKPLETIAEFVGGYRDGRPRPVRLIRAEQAKAYQTEIRFPSTAHGSADPDSWWPAIADDVKAIIERNRSTLIFCNSRARCEKLAMLINAGEDRPVAYAHHGSLSRETRTVVEQRLKNGELRAIVATGSLELGIDVGTLDEVVLIETPYNVAATIQRIGRAGHRVGEVSRGVLFPGHGRDFVQAAVMCRAVAEQDIEEVQPITAPLDVLAQVIVAAAGVEAQDIDALYELVRSSWPYRQLDRRQYDLVLAMLAGRYAETRLPALQPRVSIDRLDNLVSAGEGALRLVYQSGGTIPDRGYYAMRHDTTRARIGELDEEFVWERKPGDKFTLGTQTWRIQRITHNDVFVTPAGDSAGAPFWRAEHLGRGSHFSGRLAEFLETAQQHLGTPALLAQVRAEATMSDDAAEELVRFLVRQETATGRELPHRHHLLLEEIDRHDQGVETTRMVWHTFWGGSLTRPFALALAAAWEERFETPLQVDADNDHLVLMLPHPASAEELVELVRPDDLERLLRRRLETSGFFGARFRENAARALLLTRGGFGKRMPLWLTRARAKKLMEAIGRYPDFPILTETWRTCLQDEFELDALRERLEELADGTIRWSWVATLEPSPFAESIIWRSTNELMYLDDTPTGGVSSLSDELLREVVFSSQLRPELDNALIETFQRKLQRTAPGYEPRTADELVELVSDRALIPLDEWREVETAVPPELLADASERLFIVRLPGAEVRAIVSADGLPRLAAALELKVAALEREPLAGQPLIPTAPLLAPDDEVDPITELIAQMLQYYGPVDPERLRAPLGLDEDRFETILADLAEAERVVVDKLSREGATREVCDADHLDRLLRLTRREAAPTFTALPVERLALFLAHRQALTRRESGVEGVQRALDPLLAHPAGAANWETEILPARVPDYQPAWLDSLMQETDLLWTGAGEKQVAFLFPDQLDLIRESADEPSLDLPPGRHDFGELAARLNRPTAELHDQLWQATWAGEVTNDSVAALRRGITSRFKLAKPREPVATGSRRAGPRRWQQTRTSAGGWHQLPAVTPERDPIERLELDKDRVRLLVDRYGVLFRELLAREAPALQWSRLFRTLRLMELSGELLAGQFFEGIEGLQFTTPSGLALLRGKLPDDAVYWLNATDPASLCGLGLTGLDELPERRLSNTLVYRGDAPVVLARRSGKELTIKVPPDHPRLAEYLAFLGERQRRLFQPVGNLTIETINDEPADQSAYLEPLRGMYRLTVGFREIKLWRQPL